MVYKQRKLNAFFMADFICLGFVLVEIKAVSKLASEHRAQVINYLNASGLKLGPLVNFGHHPKLKWERIVHQSGKR